jgi:flagellar basal-body rod protein FlgF
MGNNGYISASGASAQMRDLDVVSNNLANVSTPGFKRSQSIFRSVLEASLRNGDGGLQPGAKGSAFVSTDLVGADFSSGSAQQTGSPLHAMIEGPGFFEIQTDRGSRYSRAGNFLVNREGILATANGDPVLGQSGPIAIPDGNALILPTGEVTDQNGNIFGRLKVVAFANLEKLQREGQSVFRAGDEAGLSEIESPKLIPETVEGSNVNTSRELAAMVILQRAFETNLRSMQVDDETTQRLIEGIR